jgi:hypothetical protein
VPCSCGIINKEGREEIVVVGGRNRSRCLDSVEIFSMEEMR